MNLWRRNRDRVLAGKELLDSVKAGRREGGIYNHVWWQDEWVDGSLRSVNHDDNSRAFPGGLGGG